VKLINPTPFALTDTVIILLVPLVLDVDVELEMNVIPLALSFANHHLAKMMLKLIAKTESMTSLELKVISATLMHLDSTNVLETLIVPLKLLLDLHFLIVR
jgi:hypothetical protein